MGNRLKLENVVKYFRRKISSEIFIAIITAKKSGVTRKREKKNMISVYHATVSNRGDLSRARNREKISRSDYAEIMRRQLLSTDNFERATIYPPVVETVSRTPARNSPE